VQDDPGDVDQRLHVVNERRTTEQAVRRRIGRSHAHFGPVSLQCVEQRRFFAAEVASVPADHVDVEGVPAAENPLAKDVPGTGLRECGLYPSEGRRILCPYIDESAARLNRQRRDHHRLDDRVGIFLHQEAMDVGAGITLVAIGHDVFLRRVLRGHRPPLPAGGKRRSAASAEPGPLHLVDEPIGCEVERSLDGSVTTQTSIGRKRGGTT
jgi:hypothetical protein